MSTDGLDDPAEIDAQASVLMKRGIERMNEGSMEGATEALGLFESALSLRRRLPIDGLPVYRYGLAACLLNRADVLIRLGGGDNLETALHGYEEATSLLRSLPLDDDPRFARRLAMAHQNRGIALQLRDATDPAAITAFNEALNVLAASEAVAIADRQYLQAAALVNLANAWSGTEANGATESARQASADAMKLVAETEDTDPAAAEVGLKARHILCRAVARQLSTASSRGAHLPEGVHEATDAVDDGLRLVRLWEQKGLPWFRPVAADLLVFGAIVYGTFQPHFVDEFVRENLDPASAPSEFFESVEMQDAIARLNQAFGRNNA